MIQRRSSAIKINNISENHIPNFILDRFTVPLLTLSYKLAVAAFMDAGYEAAHIQEFEVFDAVYNSGSIISEAGVKLPSISQGMQSNAIPDKISDSPANPDTVPCPWSKFMSSLSDIRKKFFSVYSRKTE